MFLRPFLSIRNEFDFALRQLLPFGRGVQVPAPADVSFAAEIQAYLSGYDWQRVLPPEKGALRVLDVGARNFAAAPALHALFSGLGYTPRIDGIEIDAYRRLLNLRTRADYGHFYAAQIPGARFHAQDFLEWKTPAEVICLLNPFVTLNPLLLWGLPRRHFRPEATFAHAASLLPKGGILVTSSPTGAEQAVVGEFAQKYFTLVQTHQWTPPAGSVQTHPRLGGLYRRN